jgi:hypothetical protein
MVLSPPLATGSSISGSAAMALVLTMPVKAEPNPSEPAPPSSETAPSSDDDSDDSSDEDDDEEEAGTGEDAGELAAIVWMGPMTTSEPDTGGSPAASA